MGPVQTYTRDGLTFEVLDAGPREGETVVLLHGFPHTKELWREVTPLLVDAGYEVIAPDLRGLGDSDTTEGGYDAVRRFART